MLNKQSHATSRIDDAEWVNHMTYSQSAAKQIFLDVSGGKVTTSDIFRIQKQLKPLPCQLPFFSITLASYQPVSLFWATVTSSLSRLRTDVFSQNYLFQTLSCFALIYGNEADPTSLCSDILGSKRSECLQNSSSRKNQTLPLHDSSTTTKQPTPRSSNHV